jgi:hypothetical protein
MCYISKDRGLKASLCHIFKSFLTLESVKKIVKIDFRLTERVYEQNFQGKKIIHKQFDEGLFILVWSAIMADGSRVPIWVDSNVHSEKYCKILAEKLFDDFDLNQILL